MVVSLAAVLVPGVATALVVMVPPSGTDAGLVTMTNAVADAPTPIAPREQSTGPLPVQPPGASVDTSVVSGGSVWTTCAFGTEAYPVLVTGACTGRRSRP